jgi:hypothetical protein
VKRSSRTRSPFRWRLEIMRRHVFVGQYAREVNFSIEESDRAIDVLEERVAALEEIIAARWPRSWRLRRRLARRLRASAATFAWAGGDFATRRAEAMSEDIQIRSVPKALRAEVAAGRPYRRPR